MHEACYGPVLGCWASRLQQADLDGFVWRRLVDVRVDCPSQCRLRLGPCLDSR
jgi:hypothetical protein